MRKLGAVGLIGLLITGMTLIPLEKPIDIGGVAVIGPAIACAQAVPPDPPDNDEECDPPAVDCPGGGTPPPPPEPPDRCNGAEEEACELCATEEDEQARALFCALCDLARRLCDDYNINNPYGWGSD